MDTQRLKQNSRSLVHRIYIRRAPVDIVEPRNLAIVLSGFLSNPHGLQVMFVRTWDLVRAHRNPELLKAMNEAALVLPVSRMIQNMAAFLGHSIPHRYYPFDSIIRILAWLENLAGSLFLLGGTPGQIVSVEQNIRMTFPGVRLLGRYPGQYPRHMDGSVAMAIQKANPDLLLAGSGLGGRQLWLYRRQRRLNKGIMIWSGEWFDFVIQRRRRPVKTAVSRGHEWISELYSHPAKLFRLPRILWFWLTLLFHRISR